MILQTKQHQVQKMTPITTRWRVTKVNSEHRMGNKDALWLRFVSVCNVLPLLLLLLLTLTNLTVIQVVYLHDIEVKK